MTSAHWRRMPLPASSSPSRSASCWSESLLVPSCLASTSASSDATSRSTARRSPAAWLVDPAPALASFASHPTPTLGDTMARTHLIGMLLGVEEDWPAAFESLLARANLSVRHGGETHRFTTERVTIEPFDLRAVPRHSLVVDRLAWWYHFPREWLKKVALMDHVHLLNNPFTFQSMEKHAAYCAMMRLGLKVPETWMLP